jgi:hypothetical protein
MSPIGHYESIRIFLSNRINRLHHGTAILTDSYIRRLIH